MSEGSPTARCEVSVANRISESLTAALRERFTHVYVTSDGKGLVIEGVDQAAVRAVVNSLWDAGAEVCHLAVEPAVRPAPTGVADETLLDLGGE